MPLPIGVFVEVTRPFMLSGEVCAVGEKLELTHNEAERLIRRDKVKLDPDAIVASEDDEEGESEAVDGPAKPVKRGRRAAA